MPEGDSVYRQCKMLREALEGAVIESSDFRVPALATSDVAGRTVVAVVPRGKHILIPVSYTHLDVYKRQVQQFPVRALGSLTVEGLQSEVKIRVGEYQSPNRGSDPIPCSDAHGTPGRISTENDARGPCLAPNAALEIVDCIEERVLGREAVVHGNDSAAQDCCETTTVGVLEVEITEHPVSLSLIHI